MEQEEIGWNVRRICGRCAATSAPDTSRWNATTNMATSATHFLIG